LLTRFVALPVPLSQLLDLHEVGAKRASAIVARRDENSAFRSVEELRACGFGKQGLQRFIEKVRARVERAHTRWRIFVCFFFF
jgi:hypothetical protein